MIADLKKIGLTEYEGKIYACLLGAGRLPARGIAQLSLVPQTAVYPNLKSLLAKGLIQQFDGPARSFEALRPSVALPAYLERKRRTLYEIEPLLVAQAEQAHTQVPRENREILNLSVGQTASLEIYYHALEHAKESIYILGWHLHTVKDKYTFLQRFKPALRRGIDARILLLGGQEKAWELIKAYQTAGIRMRYMPLQGEYLTMLIVDGVECKITLKDKRLPERYNIHVRDPSLAAALQRYFMDCWNKGHDLHPDKFLNKKGNK